MTIERRALSGTVIGAVAFTMYAGQTLLLVPVLLRAWGAERYGAWLALQSLFTLIITLDGGHQAYVGNEVAQLYFSNRRKLRLVLASAIWTAVAIGALEVLTVVALWATRLLPHALGLPGVVVRGERIDLALLVSVVQCASLTSVIGVMFRLLLPAGQFVRGTVWIIVARLLQTVSLAVAALLGAHILGASVVYAVVTLFCNVLQLYDLRTQLPELWPMHRPASIRMGVRNFLRSLILTGSTTLAQLQQTGLNLLVTATLGAVILPLFSTVRTVATTFLQVTNVICAPLAPEMARFHVNREHAKLQATFAANWLVGGTVIHLGILASLPILSPLYSTWTRHMLPFDRGLFALLAFSIALRNFGSPLQTYLVTINHLRALTAINTTQTIAVLLAAAVGLHRMGLNAAGVAVLAGELVGSCALPLVFVTLQFPPTLRTRLVRNSAFAAIPSLVTGVALLSYASNTLFHAILPVVTMAVVALEWLQWRLLPGDVQIRFRSLSARLMTR